MANIIVDIPNVTGEATMAGYVDKLEAIAMVDVIKAAVENTKTQVSEINVTRYRDRASPKLAEHCSVGTNLGTVKIHLFKNVENGSQLFMTYELTETYLSRIEHDTVDTTGTAYLPHGGFSNLGSPSSGRPLAVQQGVATINDWREYSRARAAPYPIYVEPPAAFLNREVERLWLSAKTVTWSYDVYVDGVKSSTVSAGWDISANTVLAA